MFREMEVISALDKKNNFDSEKIEFDESLSSKDYKAAQLREALADDNRYYAGLKLGHQPSAEEAVLYYINNGGADDFRHRNLRHGNFISKEDKIKYYSKRQA